MPTQGIAAAGRGTGALVREMAAVAGRPDFGPDRAAAVLDRCLTDRTTVLDDRHLTRPAGEPWALHPLVRAPDRSWSMLVAVFATGARAPVHDHGSWAVIGIYRGREKETWFRSGPGDGPALVEDRVFVNDPRTTHVVPDGVIHTVEALDEAVSIHVYGTDIVLQERNSYDPVTGAVERYQPAFTDASDG
jgi:predicted metal-dependent enzyme (double-stranded beta helix superfamily)